MAGIFSALASTGAIVEAMVKSDGDTNKAILNLIKNSGKERVLRSDGSITKFLSKFIVEPVIIISKDAKKTEVADKVIGLNADIFSSFYLQAFNVLSGIYDVNVNVAIDVLSSDTSTFAGAAVVRGAEYALGSESKVDYFGHLESNSPYLNFSCEAKGTNKDWDDLIDNAKDKKIELKDVFTAAGATDLYSDYLDVLKECNTDQADFLCATLQHRAWDLVNERMAQDVVFQVGMKHKINGITNEAMLRDLFKARKGKRDISGLPRYDFYNACQLFGGKASDYKGPHGDTVTSKVKKYLDKTDSNFKLAEYMNSKIADEAAQNMYAVHHRELKVTLDVVKTKVDPETNEKSYVGDSKRSIIIPIIVKAHIICTDTDSIINMLKPSDRTKSFSYRLDEFKSGSISLKELIFCGDIIKQYKANKLEDKDGLISIIKQREESANSKVITSGVIGFEKFYNMLIVTADEKVALNKHVGGNIDNERYKQDLLTQARALTVSIIDPDYERLYILTKDIRGKSEASFKNVLRKSGKEDNTDIMKALLQNRAPVF